MAGTQQQTMIRVPDFDTFVQDQADAIDLLKIKYARKGIELTTEQAWQYFAWCHQTASDAIQTLSSPEFTQGYRQLLTQVGEGCAAYFHQKHTGILQGPMGPRFDTPAAYEVAKVLTPEAVADVDTYKHGGYL